MVEKAVSYEAFQLTITFRHVTESPEIKSIDNGGGMFLVVVAEPVYSSYKGEVFAMLYGIMEDFILLCTV